MRLHLPILTFALAASLSASAYQFSAQNEDGVTLYFDYNMSKAVVTCGSTTPSYSGNVKIPATVSYYGSEIEVSSIDSKSFQNCSGLTSVTIPESITTIDKNAFKNCTGLTTVNFNATNCTSMGSSSKPVFEGCSALATVNFGENVQAIPSNAFYGSTNLTSANIPESVTSIGTNAFSGCAGMTTVTILESVASIGEKAFANCTSLETVNFNATECTTMGSTGSEVFKNCAKLATINIGENVKNIPAYAFKDCTALTSITIGESVKTIEQWSFDGCSGLKTINYNAKNCGRIGSTDGNRGVFAYTDDGVLYTSVDTVNIGENVESIPARAFKECSAMTTLNFSNAKALETIGNEAFNKCSGLTTVDLNNTEVTTIGEDAFSDCYILDTDSGLTNLDLGDKVTTIGARAFYNSCKLTSLDFPNSITSIGTHAFYDTLKNANTFTIHKDPAEFNIEKDAFYNNTAILINDSGVDITPSTSEYGGMFQTVDIVVKITSEDDIELDNEKPTATPFATVLISESSQWSPQGKGAPTATWSSSDPTVAQVDDKGNVTAIGEGTATITLTCTDHNLNDSTISFERTATVPQGYTPAGIDSIAADEEGGAGEVYTLQGVKTNDRDLAPGIYVRRAGDKATKVLVK